MTWHTLSSIYHGTRLTELLAAACDDGIGIIARWTRREDGAWDVEAMDTEGTDGMKPVTEFDEGESVPPEPPSAEAEPKAEDESEIWPPCPKCGSQQSYAVVGTQRRCCTNCRTKFWPETNATK
jgi:hypothetical protein